LSKTIGEGVARFQPGDKVFGTTSGLKVGANAEYVSLPEEWSRGVISAMPKNIIFAEAAALPVGAMTALALLRRAQIGAASKVLVYGASGSVGTYAVQLAKYFGDKVTAVASGANSKLVKSIGADHVIDYKTEDFTAGGTRYDIVIDAVGKIGKSDATKILAPGGRFVTVRSMTSEKGEALKEIVTLPSAATSNP
jgi:NADPH:quinone reductase-like Zn-dependent oxidoreductase